MMDQFILGFAAAMIGAVLVGTASFMFLFMGVCF